eukprot:scaffold102494_cov19-Tisochrysis_lutea.AAC.3
MTTKSSESPRPACAQARSLNVEEHDERHPKNKAQIILQQSHQDEMVKDGEVGAGAWLRGNCGGIGIRGAQAQGCGAVVL